MTDSVINWKVFDLLLSSPSKKYIKKLLSDCFILRNKTWAFDEKFKTPVIKNLCQDFSIDGAQAHSVLLLFLF